MTRHAQDFSRRGRGRKSLPGHSIHVQKICTITPWTESAVHCTRSTVLKHEEPVTLPIFKNNVLVRSKELHTREILSMDKKASTMMQASCDNGIAIANTEQNRFMPPPHRMPRRNRAQFESRTEANNFDQLVPYSTLSAEDKLHFKQCHIKIVAEEMSAESRPRTTNFNEEDLRRVADLLDT
jgi:hypothetical protein